MKVKLAIEIIKDIKMNAIKKQMYEIACNLRDVETELLYDYMIRESVDISHLTNLLQKCLNGLPYDQSLLLVPIIRKLKINQIL